MSRYNAVVSPQPEGWSDKTVASQIQPSRSFKLADALLLGQFGWHVSRHSEVDY
ncbi:hypothetical protein ACFFJN_06735 [Erwinia mallotivora]